MDWGDPALYDLVINTEKLSNEAGVELIIGLLSRPDVAATEASRQAVRDRALASRVRAALRANAETRKYRINVEADHGVIQLGGTAALDRAADVARSVKGVVDVKAHRVERAGRRIDLTPKEFNLLAYLMQNAGHVVSRTMLVEKVWRWGFDAHNNVIDVHVNRLCKKVDRDFGSKLIHTVKGIGYVAEDRGEDAAAEE